MPSTPTSYGRIYISYRPGATGTTGSATNPYDGSVKSVFDDLINNADADVEIHIGPGTYQTDGLYLKTGQTFMGAGIDSTVIKLMSAVPQSGRGQHQVIYGVGDGITVSDLTADANAQNLGTSGGTFYPYPTLVINCVELSGSRCAMLRVRGIHSFGNKALLEITGVYEAFSLAIDTSHLDTPGRVDGRLEGCIIENVFDLDGDAVNGICLVNPGTVGYANNTRGLITQCVARGIQWGAYVVWSGLLSGNQAYGCGHFMRNDTAQMFDISVVGNQMIDHSGPFVIEIRPSVQKPEDGYWGRNLLIQGNLMTYAASNPAPTHAIQLEEGITGDPPVPAGGLFENVVIQNNTIIYPATTGSDRVFAFAAPHIYRNVFINNNVSNGLPLGYISDGGAYSNTHTYLDNVTAGNTLDGLKTNFGADVANMTEIKAHNSYGQDSGNPGAVAGMGAYFGNRRGGLRWKVEAGGDTTCSLASATGGVEIDRIVVSPSGETLVGNPAVNGTTLKLSAKQAAFIRWFVADGASNQKNWDVMASSDGGFYLRLLDDAIFSNTILAKIARSSWTSATLELTSQLSTTVAGTVVLNAGVSIGAGTNIVSVKTGTVTTNIPALGAGVSHAIDITVPGVTAGSSAPAVSLGWSTNLSSGLYVIQALVSATNTVRVWLRNGLASTSTAQTGLVCRAVVHSF